MSKITSKIPEIDIDANGKLVESDYKIKNKEILFLLNRVWEKYKKYSGYQLSNWTHLPESPWYKVWEDRGKNERKKIIPDKVIEEYFLSMVKPNA